VPRRPREYMHRVMVSIVVTAQSLWLSRFHRVRSGSICSDLFLRNEDACWQKINFRLSLIL
jgi:hypothetical protein